MALATEIFESRTSKIEGNIQTGTRTFTVKPGETPPGSPPPQLTLVEANNATNLPKLNDVHPEVGLMFAVGTSGFTIKNVNLWEITWKYEGLVDDPGLIFTNEIRITLYDSWREKIIDGKGNEVPFAFFPAEGNLSDAQLELDIGGRSIDVIGAPTTATRITSTFVITEFYNTRIFAPSFVAFGLASGTRNKSSFFGAVPGTLLYGGAQSRNYRGSIVAVSHQFHFDEEFHLQHLPLRDMDGKVKVHLRSPGPTLYEVAENVFFRQPFPKQSNFFNISSQFA